MSQRQHDMGGMEAGPMEIREHDAEPWAKTITAIAAALREDDTMRIDELRRALEDLPPEVYAQDYFERWSEAIINLLEEKGLITRAEVVQRMEAIRNRLEASQ